MPALLLFLIALASAAHLPAGPTHVSADDLIGTWSGAAHHAGESSPVVLELVRAADGGGALAAVLGLPAIHARIPLGRATLARRRLDAGPLALEYHADSRTLTGILPQELVPKYDVSIELRRAGDAPAPPRQRELAAPVREPLWTVDLGAPIWADLAVRDGLVVVGTDAGTIRALDAATGATRWTVTTGGAVRSGPLFSDRDIVVQADDGWLYRVEAATGRQRWRVPIASRPATRLPLHDPASRYETHAAAPAADGDRIYVGTHEGVLLALDAASGHRIWTFKAADSIVAAPVVHRGRVYCGSMDHHLYALDAQSGALIWKHDTGEAMTSTPAIVPEQGRSNARGRVLVLAGSRSYDLEALDAVSGGSIWKKYFWFSWVESSPAIAGRVAYVGSSDAATVFAIDVRTGHSVWEADVAGSAWARPALTASTVYQSVVGVTDYIAPHRGAVVALDRSTGRPSWWWPAPAPGAGRHALTPYGFGGAVAVDDDHVFAGGLDGRVHAFAR